MERKRPRKIVLTGGPGGGKTTASDLFRREVGDKVSIVPEAATLLYLGGFPRGVDAETKRNVQRAIFAVQRSLEDTIAALHPESILLCDRGTVDGLAYWPANGCDDNFFDASETTLEAELGRYDAVIFFETAAAADDCDFWTGNPARIESRQEALALDATLR